MAATLFAEPVAPSEKAADGEIQDLDQADSALARMGHVAALQAALDAEYQVAATALKARFASKAFLVGDNGEKTTYAEAFAGIESRLLAFATANRELICRGGKKSLALNHGEIGFRLQPSALDPVEGGSAAGNSTWLDLVHGALVKGLDMLSLFTGVAASSLLKISVAVDKTAAKKALENQTLAAKELADMGFQYRVGAEKPWVKPAMQVVISHPGEPAG